MFYLVGIFRTSRPEDSISSDPEGTVPRRWGGRVRLHRRLQQVEGSLNIKRLFLIKGNQIQGIKSDRVPEELWTEVPDIVEEAVIKTTLKEKKCKKAKWLSRGGLTKSWDKKSSERQRRKGKISPSESRVPQNSKERQESLPQRSMQRNRENNKMGKTRDLFKKTRYQGNISCRWTEMVWT